MKKIVLINFLVITIALLLGQSCRTTSSVFYPYDDKNRTVNGELNDSMFSVLKKYLQDYSQFNIKDTIIIKYDFNNETCWSRLDEKDDEHIMRFVKRNQQNMRLISTTRTNVSAFNFREPGDNVNKLKLWDSSIIIDSSKQLYNLLFRQSYNCGNSILVMPNKRFIYIGSDPHSAIFYLSGRQIEALLNDK